jgi:hypothetical protein
MEECRKIGEPLGWNGAITLFSGNHISRLLMAEAVNAVVSHTEVLYNSRI